MKRRCAIRQPAPASAPSGGATVVSKTGTPRPGPAGLPRFVSVTSTLKPDLSRQPTLVRETLQQPGRPLEAATRREMERRFRRDLTGVRVHDSPAAARSADAMRAAAYTLGQHIVFGTGRFSPRSPEGRRLLAHELTHVVQQSQPGAAASAARLEGEADRNASRLDAGAPSLEGLGTAPVHLQRKAIEPTQTSAPAAGDHFAIDKGGPNLWFVFYDKSFKAVQKIVAKDPSQGGKLVDTGQIGPNWVCNNPGNMTYVPAKIGKKDEPNIAVLSRICHDKDAYPDPFSRTGIPLAVFPTMDKGRDALIAWYTALLTPDHPYWKDIGAKRGPQTLAGAISEHAPKSHGGNNPGAYAQIVTDEINQSRKSANADEREVPYTGSPPNQRGMLNSGAVTTVDPSGKDNQTLSSSDLEALVNGSEKAEGGLVPGFYWEVKESDSLPADLLKKLGSVPAALTAWCSAHAVAIP